MARAVVGDGSSMSTPRTRSFPRSSRATDAKVPSSAWQATQGDRNQFTTGGPPVKTDAVIGAPPPSRARGPNRGTWAGDGLRTRLAYFAVGTAREISTA